MTLRALQSSANRKHVQAPMTWQALNHIGQNYGSPDIDYDRFNARWESDPVLKQLVDRFDGQGLVIKTAEKPMPQGSNKAGAVDKMAKHATKNAK